MLYVHGPTCSDASAPRSTRARVHATAPLGRRTMSTSLASGRRAPARAWRARKSLPVIASCAVRIVRTRRRMWQNQVATSRCIQGRQQRRRHSQTLQARQACQWVRSLLSPSPSSSLLADVLASPGKLGVPECNWQSCCCHVAHLRGPRALTLDAGSSFFRRKMAQACGKQRTRGKAKPRRRRRRRSFPLLTERWSSTSRTSDVRSSLTVVPGTPQPHGRERQGH